MHPQTPLLSPGEQYPLVSSEDLSSSPGDIQKGHTKIAISPTRLRHGPSRTYFDLLTDWWLLEVLAVVLSL